MAQEFHQPAHITTLKHIIDGLSRDQIVSTDAVLRDVQLQHPDVSRVEITRGILEEAIKRNLPVAWGVDRELRP